MAEPQAEAAGAAAPRRVVGFVNRLSGGQMGAKVFEAAQKAGLDAVYDLSAGGPRCAPATALAPLWTRGAPPAAVARTPRSRARSLGRNALPCASSRAAPKRPQPCRAA